MIVWAVIDFLLDDFVFFTHQFSHSQITFGGYVLLLGLVVHRVHAISIQQSAAVKLEISA